MADDGGVGNPRPRVRRVDDRLGLAVLRAPLSGRSLVTYARDHVTVRTPSRPGNLAGNAIDLESPPAAGDLEGWTVRFRDTVGQLGVRRVHLRWEAPVGPGGSDPGAFATPARADVAGGPDDHGGVGRVPDRFDVAGPDEEVRAAAAELGLELVPRAVWLLDRLAPVPASGAEVVAVEAPSAVPGGAVDRRWHAATVLYRYAADVPGADGWRDWDEEAVAWSVEVQRELAADGRARVWLASRHGAPAGRLTVTHDRQGLTVLEDVVVHPVHRRHGIAAELAHRAVADRLALDPTARVGVGVEPGSVAERGCARLGFRPHAVVWSARMPE